MVKTIQSLSDFSPIFDAPMQCKVGEIHHVRPHHATFNNLEGSNSGAWHAKLAKTYPEALGDQPSSVLVFCCLISLKLSLSRMVEPHFLSVKAKIMIVLKVSFFVLCLSYLNTLHILQA